MLFIIRIVLGLVYFAVAATTGSVFCLLRPFNPDNTRICGRLFSWGMTRILGIKLVIEGRELLDQMQPSIIVANHQSNLDLFVHGAVVPKRTVSVGKKSLKYMPFFGQVYWLAGNILIDRENKRKSINTLSEVTEAITQRNTSIWVFPEGTRHAEPGLLPFKKGAFHMAMRAKAPIVPICASSYRHRLQLNRWHSGSIHVRILPAIETTQLGSHDLKALMTDTHKLMSDTISELDEI